MLTLYSTFTCCLVHSNRKCWSLHYKFECAYVLLINQSLYSYLEYIILNDYLHQYS